MGSAHYIWPLCPVVGAKVQKARLLDFGTNISTNNIAFSYAGSSTLAPRLKVFNNTYFRAQTNTRTLAQWQWSHLAVVYSLSKLQSIIYINGTPDSAQLQAGLLLNVTRTFCYIGANSDPAIVPANAHFDEVKIFNRALNATEIQADYASS
jgi:hypothetical protein